MKKVLISLLLVVCLAVNLVPIQRLDITVEAANAISSNIAKGKTIWQTGTGWGQTSVVNAVDGSTSTEWNPGAHSGGSAVTYMDLGSSAVKYNKIKVHTTQWNSDSYTLSSSNALTGTLSISSNIASAKLSSATTLFTETFSPAKVYTLTNATAGSGVTLPTSATAASTYTKVFPASTNRYVSFSSHVAASGINGNKVSEIELYYAPMNTMTIDVNVNANADNYDLAHFNRDTNTYYYSPGSNDNRLQLRAWAYDADGASLTSDTTMMSELTWWLGDTEGTTELNGIKLSVNSTGSKRFPNLTFTSSAKAATTKINCKWVQDGYTTVTASMNLKLSSTLSIVSFGNGNAVNNSAFSVTTGSATAAFINNNLITRKTATYSGEWNDITNARAIQTPLGLINDLTYYTHVNMWVYSKDATGTDIGIMFYSDGGSYFRRTFKLDFAGWKMVSIPLSYFSSNSKNGVAPTWSNITDFAFTCSGWNTTAATTADKICFDGVWMNTAYPTWEKEYEFDVVNMNNANVITTAGGTANSTYTKNARYSLAWGDMTATTSLKFTEIPRDWNTFEHIQFSIYSESITSQSIKMIINADAHESSSSYFAETIALDFAGWKTFTYKIADLTPTRTAQLDQINNITFVANGWGLTASNVPRIYIDSITAYKYPDSYGSSIPYKYETRTAYDGIKSSINGVSVGSDNILVNGTVKTLTSKTKMYDENVFAAEDAYTAWGYTVPSSAASKTEDGVTYYSLTDTLDSLGKTYYLTDRDMLIITSSSNINKIKTTENLEEYIHYMMTYKDVTFTDSDFEQIITNLKNYYSGADITEIPSDYTKVQSLLNNLNSAASTVLSSINMTDSSAQPFSITLDTSNGINAYNQYNKIASASCAYANPLSTYYKSTELKNAIIYTLDWVCTNYYGEGNMETDRTGNWWQWEIGAPQLLGQILVNMSDVLTETQIDKYLYPVNYLIPRSFYTMANKTDQAIIVLIAAALQKDSTSLLALRDSLDSVYRYNEGSGDGFYRDGSFIQHTTIPYIASYGSAMFNSLIPIIVGVHGTNAELVNPQSRNLYDWIFDSIQPFIYNGYTMDCTAGRSIVRANSSTARAMLSPFAQFLKVAEGDDLKNLKGFIKSFSTDLFFAQVPSGLSNTYLLYELRNEQVEDTNYSITKVYPMMDRAVKNSKDYAVAVSMSSARISNYESINGENMKGWYTGDGMVYLYTPQNHGSGAYAKQFFVYGNAYRMPGTTVDTKERKEVSITGSSTWEPDERFVGGVTLNDELATVAMQLDAYSYTGTDTSSTYNGGLPYFDCDLEAKKSWFMFDDEVVCLGSDINSTKDNKVETVVENMRHELTDTVTVDGTVMEQKDSYSYTSSNASWAHIDGIAGYVFPNKDKTLNVRRYTNTYGFTEMWFDHGKNPSGDTYAYVILPTKTAEETANYAENSDITVLANTASVQSVYDKSSNSTGTIFWSAGTYGGVTTNQPIVAMKKKQNGGIEFGVSDPTQTLTSATVTLDGLFVPETADENVTVTRMGNKVKLTYDLTNSKGATYTVKLKDLTQTEYSNGLIFEANSTEACTEFLEAATNNVLNYTQSAHIDGTAGSGHRDSANWETYSDWSDYTHINMWLYSENVTDSKLTLLARNNSSGTYYSRYFLPVDWSGWKLISIPLSSFTSNNSAFSWDIVKYFKMNSTGWVVSGYDSTDEGLAEVQVYVDKAWLSKSAEGTLKSYEQVLEFDNKLNQLESSLIIDNTGTAEKEAKIIIARYKNEKELHSVEFKEVTVQPGDVITPIASTLITDSEIEFVKIFVWDSFNQIKPIGEFSRYDILN